MTETQIRSKYDKSKSKRPATRAIILEAGYLNVDLEGTGALSDDPGGVSESSRCFVFPLGCYHLRFAFVTKLFFIFVMTIQIETMKKVSVE